MPALGSTRQDMQLGRTQAVNQWWPGQPYTYPQPVGWQWPQPTKRDGYANEVLVTRTEHDATLRFYRKTSTPDGKGARTLIAEITVPLGVLDAFTKEGSP